MELSKLVERFAGKNIRLKKAIGEQCDAHEIRSIDRSLNEILCQIREYRPDSLGELKQKLKFFIDEVAYEQLGDSRDFALQSLVAILESDFDDEKLAALTGLKQSITSHYIAKPANAFDIVAASNDRISIIDLNYRYVNTSQKNGQFYDSRPDRVIGKHVSELIGHDRFEKRARKFLDNCFEGSRQQYFHTLEVGQDTRIMNCHMIPLIREEDTPFGAMVAINDVTELISNQGSIVLEAI